MVEVAALAATAAVVLDRVAITATRWRIRSAANSGSLSSLPWAQRNSIATFFPSTSPASLKPLRNPARRLAFGSGEPECRNPMTGIAACCARNERPGDRTACDQRDEIAPSHDLLPARAGFHGTHPNTTMRVLTIRLERG